MNFSNSVLVTAMAATLSLPAIAEEQSPIIVTATRTAQTIDDSLASVTVITAEQIEQQQAHDLLSLLTSVSGIDMTNNGGMGKTTNVFMRGTASSHILMMVDGIKVGSATTGSVAFQHIPVSQIERIEIVRGPRASLYGSEAVGGVIQIFTKKGKKQKQKQASVELGSGSYGTKTLAAGISGKQGNTSYSINANHLSSDGFTVQNGSETDDDGYDNNSITLNASHQFSKTSSLDLNLLQAYGHTEFDGFYNSNDFVQQTTGLQYSVAALVNWNIKLSASQSQDQSDNFSGTTFKTKYNTTRDMFSWQNDIDFSTNQLLTFGVDYQNDLVESTTNYNETSRKNTAGFIQHQWNGEENDLQVALRNDNNEAFGSHTTGNLAWGHNFENKLRLIASHGTAFKAPTFNDLYWPGAGNLNLKPEQSASTEVELRNKQSWGKWSVSAYHTTIDNLISGWPPTNVNKAEIKGIEVRIDTIIAGWNTQLELAALDPRDKESNKILQRRTQRTLKLNMDKTFGSWTNGFSIISQGHRYDDAANKNRVNGYSFLNLRTSYAISKTVSVKAKIENLFDVNYETVKGYNNPGQSVFVSVKYQGF
jgi:vitamin B12 transporter